MSGNIEQQVGNLTRRVNRLDRAREHDRFKVQFKKLENAKYYKVEYDTDEFKAAENIWWAYDADGANPLYINDVHAYYMSLEAPEYTSTDGSTGRIYKLKGDENPYVGKITFKNSTDIVLDVKRDEEIISHAGSFELAYTRPTYSCRRMKPDHKGSHLYMKFAADELKSRLIVADKHEAMRAISNNHVECFYAKYIPSITNADETQWKGIPEGESEITFTKELSQVKIEVNDTFVVGTLHMEFIFDVYVSDNMCLYYKLTNIPEDYEDVITDLIGDETSGHFTYTDEGLFTDLFLVGANVWVGDAVNGEYVDIFHEDGFTMTYTCSNGKELAEATIKAAAGPLPQERAVFAELCKSMFRYDPLHVRPLADNSYKPKVEWDPNASKYTSTINVESAVPAELSEDQRNGAVMRIQTVESGTHIAFEPYGDIDVKIPIAKEVNGTIFATEKLADFARIVDATVDSSLYSNIPVMKGTNLTTTTASPMTMTITTGPSLIKDERFKQPVKMQHGQGLCFGVNMPIGDEPWINYGGSLFNINKVTMENVKPPCQYVIKEDEKFVVDDPSKGERDGRLFYILDKDYMIDTMGKEEANSREPFLLFSPLHQDCPNCETIQ